MNRDRIVFLDFEASSLGPQSYPIEVGWAILDLADMLAPAITTQAYLIRPEPDWTDWSTQSAAIHNIPRERLHRDGRPATEVATLMNQALAGDVLHVDGHRFDIFWCDRLFVAAGQAEAFQLARIERAFDGLRRDQVEAGLQYYQGSQLPHRADLDAALWARAYLAAIAA